VLRHRPAAVIFLGDIQADKPLEQFLAPILSLTEVWFIHGNHDSDSEQEYQHLFASELAERNLHGKVVEIAGRRVAGLGGVFREEVWFPERSPARHDNYEDYGQFVELNRRIRPVNNDVALANRVATGKLLKHRSTIFPQIYNTLALDQADILVTHEAPSCHRYGFGAIDELAKALGVKQAFHGHHHDSLDYRKHWARLKLQAYGVGLCGILDVDGRIIQAGKCDQVRTTR
jgi:predicted phosphodiesterase